MKLSIIIVNWNTRELILQCIDSIMKSAPYLDFEIIVVDNNSSDGSVEAILNSYPSVKMVANDTNAGFAGGNNQGIVLSKGDYILLLNPDIVVHNNALQKMVAFLDDQVYAGAVGALLYNPDGTVQRHGMYGYPPSLVQVVLFRTMLFPISNRVMFLSAKFWEPLDLERTREVEHLPGACIMVRREVLNNIGKLDENFRIWFEDVDWSVRIKEAGFKLYLYPEATMTHYCGQSFKIWNNLTYKLRFNTSMYHYFLKHEGRFKANIVKWIVIFDALIQALLLPIVSMFYKSPKFDGVFSTNLRFLSEWGRWLRNVPSL